MKPKTYPREKVMELCRDLGHDPGEVSNIMIEPHQITVLYLHPITDKRQDGFRASDVIGVE